MECSLVLSDFSFLMELFIIGLYLACKYQSCGKLAELVRALEEEERIVEDKYNYCLTNAVNFHTHF